MPTPEVLSGLREPRTVRLEAARARDAAAAAAPESAQAPVSAPLGVTVYVSNIRRYRVEVAPPVQVTDPTTGRRTTVHKRITVQFDEGTYRNNERGHNTETRKLIDESLQTNPHFGKFGTTAHFWLASDQNEHVQQARIKSALDTLKSLPREVVDGYMATLKQGDAEDHVLPPAETPRGVRPIPPHATQ